MNRVSFYIYGRGLYQIILIIALSVILWGIFGSWITTCKRGCFFWKFISCFLTIISIFVVVYMTVLSRNPNSIYEVRLIPFYSLFSGENQEEFLRTLLMNTLLFVPLGLGLPYVFPEKIKHNVFYSIGLAMVLSIVVEVLQYIWGLGYAETNDVICNTVGCAIGTLSYVLQNWLNHRSRKSS